MALAAILVFVFQWDNLFQAANNESIGWVGNFLSILQETKV